METSYEETHYSSALALVSNSFNHEYLVRTKEKPERKGFQEAT